jgi:hypothetical protein
MPPNRWYNTKNDWEGIMWNEEILIELLKYFKQQFGIQLSSSEDLFEAERNLLKYLVTLGRELEQKIFDEIGTGYQGNVIEADGVGYEFKGNREKTLHGLFGYVRYNRAYYVGKDGRGSYVPLDKKLGIGKKHTPGCSYFFTFFSGSLAYQQSLKQFHEIFRPDGKQELSPRKVLDMDYELGQRLEAQRQKEIRKVFEQGQEIESQDEVVGTMGVSIDATKVREKLGEELTHGGKKKYEIGFRDAKIATVSKVLWDKENKEAKCESSSYVSGIEHADAFFKRIWVEMNRRCSDLDAMRIVFLGDGAEWIWNRVGDLSNRYSVEVLDIYHACEHLSDLCKALYGEQSEEFWQHYHKWRKMFKKGKVEKVLKELREIRDAQGKSSVRNYLQGQISYFEQNKDRMHYDRYIKMKLPIGSGTVESACKNVIGGRMKQGGMTWSESGAAGMLQIRVSQKSGRYYADFKKTLPRAA